MQKRHSLYIIHTSQLRSICFSFETFTTLISQLNFCFSLFFFQASIHFHFLYFFSFLFTSYSQNRCFSFLIFFQCLLGYSRVVAPTNSHFRSPQLIFYSPQVNALDFLRQKNNYQKFLGFKKKDFDISPYFKQRFNCLSSKGFTNTLSAHG